jgi:hypothetical protein
VAVALKNPSKITFHHKNHEDTQKKKVAKEGELGYKKSSDIREIQLRQCGKTVLGDWL